MPFEFKKLNLDGLILIKPSVYEDSRGVFLESYKKSLFFDAGIDCEFVQDNHSKSQKNVLRGLHFQTSPKSQAKLVRCVSGKIYDVAVDLRKNSKTYKQWVRVELSQENKHMLFIPKGFAHGFVVLSKEADVVYKIDEEFSQEHDKGVLWCDEELNIDWGIDFEPILSEKDKNLPTLCSLEDLL